MSTPRYDNGTPHCLACNGTLTKTLDGTSTVYRCDKCRRDYIAPIEVQMKDAGMEPML